MGQRLRARTDGMQERWIAGTVKRAGACLLGRLNAAPGPRRRDVVPMLCSRIPLDLRWSLTFTSVNGLLVRMSVELPSKTTITKHSRAFEFDYPKSSTFVLKVSLTHEFPLALFGRVQSSLLSANPQRA